MDTATAYDRAIAYAAERGAQDGRNAAEWYVQDAFRDGPGHPRTGVRTRILRGLDDGDPAVLDALPAPDLSGQWADALTGPMLVADALDHGILYTADPAEDDATAESLAAIGSTFSDICDAYEAAFSDAVSVEIERAARTILFPVPS